MLLVKIIANLQEASKVCRNNALQIQHTDINRYLILTKYDAFFTQIKLIFITRDLRSLSVHSTLALKLLKWRSSLRCNMHRIDCPEDLSSLTYVCNMRAKVRNDIMVVLRI